MLPVLAPLQVMLYPHWNVGLLSVVIASGSTVTVTVAVHVLTLPLLSVTVSVTVFAPLCVQSNVFGSSVFGTRSFTPHASLLPLSISDGSTVLLPEIGR